MLLLASAGHLSDQTVMQTNLSELRTALLGDQSLFCTVTAQRCEIQREAFEFATQWIRLLQDLSEKHSNSAQKSIINRSNGSDIENQKQ